MGDIFSCQLFNGRYSMTPLLAIVKIVSDRALE